MFYTLCVCSLNSDDILTHASQERNIILRKSKANSEGSTPRQTLMKRNPKQPMIKLGKAKN